MDYQNCKLCPRGCWVDLAAGQTGFCGAPGHALVAKTMLHQWEEPILSPAGKSGAVFFGGCTLRCRYCQNAAISRKPAGKAVDSRQLRAILEDLIAQGAENIDLVTPTHYLPTILPALEPKLPVPVVYNCGGYESVETLRALEGKVQIYLPDMKYSDGALARKLSGAGDYPEVAKAAILEMFRQTGPYELDGEGMLRKGVLIRHLVLPGEMENTFGVLDWIADTFREGDVLVSLMGQYTPNGVGGPDRRLTQEEYRRAADYMLGLGLYEGYTQEISSAREEYTPPFDGTGVMKEDTP